MSQSLRPSPLTVITGAGAKHKLVFVDCKNLQKWFVQLFEEPQRPQHIGYLDVFGSLGRLET